MLLFVHVLPYVIGTVYFTAMDESQVQMIESDQSRSMRFAFSERKPHQACGAGHLTTTRTRENDTWTTISTQGWYDCRQLHLNQFEFEKQLPQYYT
jgi:hypothetical protein